MSALGTHAVKVRLPDGKAWYFLTPDGGANRLRIHAATMSAVKAAEVAARVPETNSGVQARAVKL